MYIIDKNKDFYDYYSHIYGVDKAVTFDRRGSIVIDDEHLTFLSEINARFNHSCKGFVVLEIGNIQHLVKLSDFVFKKGGVTEIDIFVSCKVEIVRTFKDDKHYYDSTISVRGVNVKGVYQWAGWKSHDKMIYDMKGTTFSDVIQNVYDRSVELPILSNTQLTSLLDADSVWKELQNYISSLKNDKDVDIKTTDIEKVVNHGFDKKISFRHPIK